MDLKSIKEVINNGLLSNDQKEQIIISILANDPQVIPTILEILEDERLERKEIMGEMNLLLSQADTIIDEPKLNREKFFTKKVSDFYEKYKGKKGVGHCFKNPNKK